MVVHKSTKNLKPAGKLQQGWNLATNEKGDMTYITTSIGTPFARNAEEWSMFLVAEKKIPTNSSYATMRYIAENGIRALDTTMRGKYGEKKVA